MKTRLKQSIRVLLSVLMTLTMVSILPVMAATNNPYQDVQQTDWFYDSVMYVQDKGLMYGTSDTTFEPWTTVSRAMTVTVLHRMGNESTADPISFKDVPVGTWFTNAVAWAAADGIVNGYNKDTFGPNDNVTREQIATILFRYAEKKGYNVSKREDLKTFADNDDISDWAKEALAWANAESLVKGLDDNTLAPGKNATRVQLATIIMRFCEMIAKPSDDQAEDSNTDQKYAIVISADAPDTEVYAAQVLSEYLSALNGDNYPIINDHQSFEGFKFCVGATSAYDTSDITDKAADSYRIAPFKNGLAIYGSGSRGTVYGVYSFLEGFCGYRVYTAESGMVSTSGEMVLPEKKMEYNTYFEYRNTDWRSGWTPLYSVANKLNGDLHGAVTHEQGGNISYLGGSSHTLSTVFCSSDKYFESHPDYFALHDGKRVPNQLCLTNDAVYKIVLKEVLDLLKDSHDPKADLQIISLSQADNEDYCQCDACKALDSANGSHAGTMITFVNRIAHAVKEEGYDNVEFDTFAYRYTRKAPSAVIPEDNVIVRLCTFECCFSHPMDDPGCPENLKLMRDLEEWSKICKKMYIWDYTTNYACTLGIFPDFHVLQQNIQCFYEHGIRGVYEEGNYYIHLCDTEFGDLRTYLIAKLLENPYCDYEAEMLDFCNYYYGEGGQFIKGIIDEITYKIKGHVTIYSSMTDSFFISDGEAEKIDHLWSMAENAAGKEYALAAIERSKLSWRYVKAALGLREFSGTLEENRNEREALYHDLISHGVEMIDEWTSIEHDFAKYEQIPVEEWESVGR